MIKPTDSTSKLHDKEDLASLRRHIADALLHHQHKEPPRELAPLEWEAPPQNSVPSPPNGPPALPTPVIAALFAIDGPRGIKFDAQGWKQQLKDPSEWLKECRVSQGKKPKPSSWNPIRIAQALVAQGYAVKKVAQCFRDTKAVPEIARWLPALDEWMTSLEP